MPTTNGSEGLGTPEVRFEKALPFTLNCSVTMLSPRTAVRLTVLVRPLLIVAPRPDRHPNRERLIEFLGQQFPRWMLPDDVVVVDELPHTATGKLMKTRLREMFHNHELPDR